MFLKFAVVQPKKIQIICRNDRGPREEDPDAGRSDQSDDWRRGPPPPPRESDRDRDR